MVDKTLERVRYWPEINHQQQIKEHLGYLTNKRICGEEKEERWIKLGLVKFLSPGFASRENGENEGQSAESLANYEAETCLTSHLHHINAGLRDSLFTVPMLHVPMDGTNAQQHRAFYDTPRHRTLNHLWSPHRSRELLDYVYGNLSYLVLFFTESKTSMKRNETNSFYTSNFEGIHKWNPHFNYFNRNFF